MTQEIEFNTLSSNPSSLAPMLSNADHSLSQSSNLSIPAARLETLHRRMSQLERAVLGLNKKENYVNAMAVDLEHIITILIKRLDNEPLK